MARTKLSLATFNLYNLNLPNHSMYNNSEGWTEEEYALKINWTASILKILKADVWGFQELWHPDALNEALRKASLEDHYDVLTPPDHQGNKIVCAAAVKKGILVGEPEWIVNFHDKFKMRSKGDDPQMPEISIAIKSFSRPVLRFQIQPKEDAAPITVFVAHLKSKRPAALYYEDWYNEDRDFYKKHSSGLGYAISTIRRTAEAAALRMLITEELKYTETPLIVLGDLNDGQLSNTLNTLTGQPNYLLNGYMGGSDVGLYTVGTLQEYRSLRDVYYSHVYQNIKESLDHILISEQFYDSSKKRIWAFRDMEILNDHLNSENHKENGTSDHGVIKATFDYRPI